MYKRRSFTNRPWREEKFPNKLSAQQQKTWKGVIVFYVQIILVMANTDFVCDWSYSMHRPNAGENLNKRNKIYKR